VWNWAVWGALVVAICSGIAASVILFRSVREAVRCGARVRAKATASLGALAAKAEVAAAKAESAGDTRELETAVARLRGSLRQLAVLRAALEEVDRQFGWVRVLLLL
jgi:hypothetical protein